MKPRYRVAKFIENEGYPPMKNTPYGFVRTDHGWYWYYKIA